MQGMMLDNGMATLKTYILFVETLVRPRPISYRLLLFQIQTEETGAKFINQSLVSVAPLPSR
jgi:hypothetical protein